MKKDESISDQQLLDLARKGDRMASRLLFNQYFPMLVNKINHFIRDRMTAEDLAQDIMFRLLQKPISITTSLESYLRRSATNEALNYIKKEKRFIFSEPESWEQEIADTSDEDNELRLFNESREARLRKAIDNLPEKCRVVFILNRMEEYTHKEISEMLDISTKTVENHMTRALRLITTEMLGTNTLILVLLFFYKIFIL